MRLYNETSTSIIRSRKSWGKIIKAALITILYYKNVILLFGTRRFQHSKEWELGSNLNTSKQFIRLLVFATTLLFYIQTVVFYLEGIHALTHQPREERAPDFRRRPLMLQPNRDWVTAEVKEPRQHRRDQKLTVASSRDVPGLRALANPPLNDATTTDDDGQSWSKDGDRRRRDRNLRLSQIRPPLFPLPDFSEYGLYYSPMGLSRCCTLLKHTTSQMPTLFIVIKVFEFSSFIYYYYYNKTILLLSSSIIHWTYLMYKLFSV